MNGLVARITHWKSTAAGAGVVAILGAAWTALNGTITHTDAGTILTVTVPTDWTTWAIATVPLIIGALYKPRTQPPSSSVQAAVVVLASVGAAVTLSGCAGAVPWNPQGYAGITDTHVRFSPLTDKDGAITDYRISDIRVRDGKEKQDVKVAADLKAGTASYSAAGVAAFQGQKTRADVEAQVTESLKNLGIQIAPEVMQALVDIVTKAVGIP